MASHLSILYLQRLLVLLALLVVMQSPQQIRSEEIKIVHIDHARIVAKHEAEVAAQESGVLKDIKVTEGVHVNKGEILAQLDNALVAAHRNKAKAEHKAALLYLDSDIQSRHAYAEHCVAQLNYEQSTLANSKVHGTIPRSEIRRLKLAWETAALDKEQAAFELRHAALTAEVRAAGLEIAEVTFNRYAMHSPFQSEVIEVSKNVGEWVNAGEMVFRLVHCDTLYVEGYVDGTKSHPREIANQTALVSIQLERGRQLKASGKVVFVAPILNAGGEFLARIEIDNQKENDSWQFFPGQRASVAIGLKQGATEK